MDTAQIILTILSVFGTMLVISWLRDLNTQVENLRKQVGTLDRPVCHFDKNYKRKPKKEDK